MAFKDELIRKKFQLDDVIDKYHLNFQQDQQFWENRTAYLAAIKEIEIIIIMLDENNIPEFDVKKTQFEYISKNLKDPYFGLSKKLVKITKKSYYPNIPEEILPAFGEIYELKGIRYFLVDLYHLIEDILAEEKRLGYKLVFSEVEW